MFLAAITVFAVYSTSVALGAFMGDVSELLVLFAASILFVTTTLQRGTDRKGKNGGYCQAAVPR